MPIALAASGEFRSCPIFQPPLRLPPDEQTSTLTADQAELVNQIATAKGHAHLERDGQTLEAPFLSYNRGTSEASARGGLAYRRSDLYLTASKGAVNIDRRTGQFDDAHYFLLDRGASGQSKRVTSLGANRYDLTHATYSTCPGPRKAWQLAAKDLKLNRRSGRGVAHDATMKIYGVPVLYSPYLSFPIDNQRHSGFLVPTVGTSSSSGFELSDPYYFNLAPNYDATLIPRVMSARGFQLGAQFRYLTRHQVGEFDGAYLPADQKYGADRWLVHFHDVGKLTSHIGIAANYSRVSDDQYFYDLSNNLAHTSTSNLDRHFELTAAVPGVRFSALVQDFQTLYNRFIGLNGLYSNHPYRRLPQLELNALTPTAPFQAGIDAQFTNFERSDSVDGYRTDLRPRLVWGTDHGGWYANSQLAYRFTHYDLRNLAAAGSNGNSYFTPDKRSINRGIPSFEADVGLRASRTFGNGWTQTLEPRLQYLYVGYENQSDIPIFDTGAATLQYDSLFASNRYTGLDRIGDANQITLGLRSRLISPNSGRTVAAFEFGRVTSFRRLRVGLPYAGQTGYGRHGSDYLVGGRFSPNDLFHGEAVLEYGSHWSQINRAATTLTIGRPGSYQLDLGYRYYRDYRPALSVTGQGVDAVTTLIPGQFETLSQTTIGVRAPIGDRLNLIARWNYSLEAHQNVETLAGIEYRPSCCYAVRLAWRRYVGGYNRGQKNAVMLQLVLRGLGKFGNSISSFASGNVFSAVPYTRSSDTFDTIGSP